MKYVITGTSSGLGRYLYENIPNSVAIDRTNLESSIQQIESDDIIIHCAFNKTNDIQDYSGYLDDNIFLTKRLLDLGNTMIYISSVDVYSQENVYALFKKFAESLVNHNESNLILRCPALVGEHMSYNHLHKIRANEKITLSGQSTFNYILYSDVLDTILNTDKTGVYNLLSRTSVDLNTIKTLFKSDTIFGSYFYQTPMVISAVTDTIHVDRTSIETIKDYFL